MTQEIEPEPRADSDSPLTHVVVEYYEEPAGVSEPIERVTMSASTDPNYALADGKTGHLWDHIADGVEIHVKGECDCVDH